MRRNVLRIGILIAVCACDRSVVDTTHSIQVEVIRPVTLDAELIKEIHVFVRPRKGEADIFTDREESRRRRNHDNQEIEDEITEVEGDPSRLQWRLRVRGNPFGLDRTDWVVWISGEVDRPFEIVVELRGDRNEVLARGLVTTDLDNDLIRFGPHERKARVAMTCPQNRCRTKETGGRTTPGDRGDDERGHGIKADAGTGHGVKGDAGRNSDVKPDAGTRLSGTKADAGVVRDHSWDALIKTPRTIRVATSLRSDD